MQEKAKSRPKKNIKKSKKKSKKIFRKCLILILIILAVIIFAFITPIFNITQITVEGNEKIDTETIISLSGLNIEQNIFRNSKSKVRENIKEEPYIANVTMKRMLPGTVELTVEERNVAYQIKLIDGYIYIDEQGYILENSTQDSKTPILEGFTTSQDELLNGKRLNTEDLNKLNTILKITEAMQTIKKESLITTINAENNNQYILYLKSEKKYLYLGDGSNLSNKMLYVQTMLKEEKGKTGIMFLDGNLNDGFKPYFREEKIK